METHGYGWITFAGVLLILVGIFNVIDDPDLSQQRYFRTLSEVRSRPLRIVYLPVSLISPAVKAVDFAHRLGKRRPCRRKEPAVERRDAQVAGPAAGVREPRHRAQRVPQARRATVAFGDIAERVDTVAGSIDGMP